jgi:hypothetical protein
MPKTIRKAPHHPRLVCGVRRLADDFVTREGELYLPAGHCCDMSGAIEVFTAIDGSSEHRDVMVK